MGESARRVGCSHEQPTLRAAPDKRSRRPVHTSGLLGRVLDPYGKSRTERQSPIYALALRQAPDPAFCTPGLSSSLAACDRTSHPFELSGNVAATGGLEVSWNAGSA